VSSGPSLAEVVSPQIAIVVAAGCGFAAIACFAPRSSAATLPREER
jgi:hypothetical protein